MKEPGKTTPLLFSSRLSQSGCSANRYCSLLKTAGRDLETVIRQSETINRPNEAVGRSVNPKRVT